MSAVNPGMKPPTGIDTNPTPSFDGHLHLPDATATLNSIRNQSRRRNKSQKWQITRGREKFWQIRFCSFCSFMMCPCGVWKSAAKWHEAWQIEPQSYLKRRDKVPGKFRGTEREQGGETWSKYRVSFTQPGQRNAPQLSPVSAGDGGGNVCSLGVDSSFWRLSNNPTNPASERRNTWNPELKRTRNCARLINLQGIESVLLFRETPWISNNIWTVID